MMRKFKLENGSTFETNLRATRFKFDTCGCKLIYDDNMIFLATDHKCNLHRVIPDGPALLAVVFAHNRSFNLRDGRNPTEQQHAQQGLDKAAEKERIRNL